MVTGNHRGGDYDMPALLAGLHRDHANTARLLAFLDRQIGKLDSTESPDYEAMLDTLDYFTTYPDQYHHRNEDLLFSRLMDRDASSREVVGGLIDEHTRLAADGRALMAVLENILADQFVARSEVKAQAERYSKMFHDHMLTEENEVFPLARQVLSARDWLSLDDEFAQRDDPLFGDIVEHRYVALAEALAETPGRS